MEMQYLAACFGVVLYSFVEEYAQAWGCVQPSTYGWMDVAMMATHHHFIIVGCV
jgi:hypothetical protein